MKNLMPFLGLTLCYAAFGADQSKFYTSERVGALGSNAVMTPVHQLLTPAGRQVELPEMRPQALALSPDGRLLAVSGKTSELVLLNPQTGEIRQRLALPATPSESKPDTVSDHILSPDKDAQVSYTGLIFSADGMRIYLSSVNGTIKVFAVDKAGRVTAIDSLKLPAAIAPERKVEIPAGLALSRDGKRLYVAFNLSNRLAELDAGTGKVLRTWDVGVAPYDVVACRRTGSMSAIGVGAVPKRAASPGRRAAGCSCEWIRCGISQTKARFRSWIWNPAGWPNEILTGLHASALALSPNGRYLVVANAASDTLSVIDTRTESIIETIWTRQTPADPFGAAPNALAFDKSGRRFYVCNGSQNAVGVVEFSPRKSRLRGLDPDGLVSRVRSRSMPAAMPFTWPTSKASVRPSALRRANR